MARIVNAGNQTVFEMSKAAALKMLLVCLFVLGMSYWAYGEKMQTGTWDYTDVRTYFSIFITLVMAIVGIMLIITLLTGKGTVIVMDREKLTYSYCFFTRSWLWRNMEDLHLGVPPQLKGLPLVALLSTKLARDGVGDGNPDLRFKEQAPSKHGKRHFLFVSHIDGYTSVPLGFFVNPEEILQAARSYNKAALK